MGTQLVSIDKALMKAKSLTKKGNLNEAKHIYKNVLLRFPKNTRALRALQNLTLPNKKIINTSLPQNIFNQLVYLHKQSRFDDLLDLIFNLLKKYPNEFFLYHMNGLVNKVQGNMETAINSFKKAIDLNPNFVQALFQIGNIYKSQGRLEEAINIFQKLLSIDSKHFYALNNLGKSFQDLGKLDEAMNSYKKALSINPNYANGYNNLGTVLKEQGKLDDAINAYKNALTINPNYANSYNNIGTVLKEQSNFDLAITYYKKALVIDPNFTQALFNIGVVHQEKNNFDQAIDFFKKVLLIDPEFIDSYIYLGDISRKEKKFEEAISSYNKALKINPYSIRALFKKGSIYKAQGRLDLALNIYNQVLNIEPNNYNAYNNIGSIKIEKLCFKEALDNFNKAVSLNPNFTLAFFNIGLIEGFQKNYKQAIKNFEKAISLKPDFEIATTKLINVQANICDWDGIKTKSEQIPRLGTYYQEVTPFSLLSLEDNPENHKKRSKILAEKRYFQNPIPFKSTKINHHKPIRIGYFSSDFKEHPVAYLIAGIIANHDRNEFEVFGYSIKGTKKDNLNKKLSKLFDVYKDISHINDQDAALLARRDEIDIAIDLNGYTQNSRPAIFAYRAAPIQINYLGFPGTMGANFMDYIIADHYLIPERSQKFFTEKPIYLPNTYMPTDDTREISNRYVSRKEYGLPEDCFIFCCFNNNYKITSEEFDIWMKILGKINKSILWLRKSNEWSEVNFRKEAIKRNIDPSRIFFAERASMEDHLARHKLADLFIDTFKFNAHTTASEALWAGLPVVTKVGKGFPARVAASLLRAIDLPELVTETNQDYESLILNLATDENKLMKVRKKLEKNRLSKPLFDTERYTKHLEDGFKKVYQNYCEGKKPQVINIKKN